MRKPHIMAIATVAVAIAGAAQAAAAPKSSLPPVPVSPIHRVVTETLVTPFGTKTWTLRGALPDHGGVELAGSVLNVSVAGVARVVVDGGPVSFFPNSSKTNLTYWAARDGGKVKVSLVLFRPSHAVEATAVVLAFGHTKTIRMSNQQGKTVAVLRLTAQRSST